MFCLIKSKNLGSLTNSAILAYYSFVHLYYSKRRSGSLITTLTNLGFSHTDLHEATAVRQSKQA